MQPCTMQHIFYFEWLSLRRNSLLIGIIGLLVALSLYAITYGTGVTHSRREIIDVLRAEEAGRRSEWVNRFAADTSTAEGRNAYQAVRDPFSTEDIFRYTIYAPGPLAALSIGQADVYPYFRRVSARSLYYDGYGIRFDETYGELTNPEKLLAGNLDLSFVFVYLLPLLIIALGYNLLSAEQEQGTYPLLATLPRSLRTILAGKLLFRYLIIAVLIVLLSLLGFGITGVLGQAAFAEAGLWLLVALSYAAFWFALVWLVVSLRYGSASNALLLLGAWLLFLVLIPGLLNNYLNDTHPVSARAELMSSVREEMEDLWDRVTADTSFNRQLVRTFSEQYPAFRTDTLSFPPPNTIALHLWHFALDQHTRPIARAYEAATDERYRAGARFNWLNPAVNAQELFNQLSGTDYRTYRQFREAVHQYQEQFRRISLQFAFVDGQVGPEAAGAYPPFTFRASVSLPAFAAAWFALLAATALLAVTGFFRLGKGR